MLFRSRVADGEIFPFYDQWLKQPGMVEYDPAVHGYREEVAAALGLEAPAPTTAPAAAAQAVKVTWFAARDTTGFVAKQVEDFNKNGGGKVTIDYQEQGQQTSDLRDKFVLVANAKDPAADMISMDVPYVPEFAAAGWTIDVEKVLPSDEKIGRAHV